VTFLNNFQVFLKGLKGRHQVLVTISQGFILFDEGIGFVLERFEAGRSTIIGRIRGVGDNCLDRRRGIFFHPSVVSTGGGFRAAGVQWGGLGGFHPPSLCPFVY